MAPPSWRFPESFVRTLACNCPRSRAHWHHWMRTSNSSADHQSAPGTVVSVPSLKRVEKIFALLRHSSTDIARNCGHLRTGLPKSFCPQVLEASFALPEIRDAPGRRALLHNNYD